MRVVSLYVGPAVHHTKPSFLIFVESYFCNPINNLNFSNRLHVLSSGVSWSSEGTDIISKSILCGELYYDYR